MSARFLDQTRFGTFLDNLAAVFASVAHYGGKITRFLYERGGECMFQVSGCSCEDFMYSEYCVVSFRNSEPEFHLVFPAELFSFPVPIVPQNEKRCREEIREISSFCKTICALGVTLHVLRNDESVSQLRFRCEFSVVYSLLRLCAELCERLSWRENSLAIEVSKTGCHIDVFFVKNCVVSQSILMTSATFAYLFCPSENQGQIPKRSAASQNFRQLVLPPSLRPARGAL